MERLTKGKRPVLAAIVIYTSIALITVLSAWISGLHRYDLTLTISKYVALRPWTAVVYAICILFMFALIMTYIKRLKIEISRKIVYYLIFVCILGVGVFPSNREWSILISDIHNYFAYTLMAATTLSFAFLLLKGRTAQKIFAALAIAYSVFFLVSFIFIEWQSFINTIFIWEMTFIYLLITELALE